MLPTQVVNFKSSRKWRAAAGPLTVRTAPGWRRRRALRTPARRQTAIECPRELICAGSVRARAGHRRPSRGHYMYCTSRSAAAMPAVTIDRRAGASLLDAPIAPLTDLQLQTFTVGHTQFDNVCRDLHGGSMAAGPAGRGGVAGHQSVLAIKCHHARCTQPPCMYPGSAA